MSNHQRQSEKLCFAIQTFLQTSRVSLQMTTGSIVGILFFLSFFLSLLNSKKKKKKKNENEQTPTSISEARS